MSKKGLGQKVASGFMLVAGVVGLSYSTATNASGAVDFLQGFDFNWRVTVAALVGLSSGCLFCLEALQERKEAIAERDKELESLRARLREADDRRGRETRYRKALEILKRLQTEAPEEKVLHSTQGLETGRAWRNDCAQYLEDILGQATRIQFEQITVPDWGVSFSQNLSGSSELVTLVKYHLQYLQETEASLNPDKINPDWNPENRAST